MVLVLPLSSLFHRLCLCLPLCVLSLPTSIFSLIKFRKMQMSTWTGAHIHSLSSYLYTSHSLSACLSRLQRKNISMSPLDQMNNDTYLFYSSFSYLVNFPYFPSFKTRTTAQPFLPSSAVDVCCLPVSSFNHFVCLAFCLSFSAPSLLLERILAVSSPPACCGFALWRVSASFWPITQLLN